MGAFTPTSLDEPDGEEEFEDSWDEDDDPLGPPDDAVDNPPEHEEPVAPAPVLPRPSRIYDAAQEAAQW